VSPMFVLCALTVGSPLEAVSFVIVCAQRTPHAWHIGDVGASPSRARYHRVPKFWTYGSVCCACAEVTANIILFSMGPKLRYPTVARVIRVWQSKPVVERMYWWQCHIAR
jgi:hypothetical protein